MKPAFGVVLALLLMAQPAHAQAPPGFVDVAAVVTPKSWPSNRSVSALAQSNRALLADAMMRAGVRPYDKEWWHFTLADEPFPDTYFDFPVR